MKFAFAILSLVICYCTVNAASIGNANELDPLVKYVTKNITILARTLESTTPVKEIIDASEEIINAAQVLISEANDMLANENLENDMGKDNKKNEDIMQFIAKNVVDPDEVVQVLFADDQLDEDDWRVVLLVRSLILGGQGLQFEHDKFKSATNDEEKQLALENLGVWGQAVVRIAGALISAIDDAEMTLRARMGLFRVPGEQEDQVAPSTPGPTAELPSDGNEENSDKHERHRRQSFTFRPFTFRPNTFMPTYRPFTFRPNTFMPTYRPFTVRPYTILPPFTRPTSPWSISRDGLTYTRDRHSFTFKPTFDGFRPTGGSFGYTFRF